jgi:HAD superfamily hydrolase (TIGR01509 family)
VPQIASKLVIFDCDGVLVDSEPISVAVLLELIEAAGGTVSEEQAYRLFLGRSMASVRDVLRSDFGLTLTGRQLDGMRAELARRFRSDLKAVPGVTEALPRLEIPFCVASSGSLDRIRLSLGITGLLEMLEPHLYSASMVARGKPAPDLFLHAARDMGVAPAACVVIEDSPAGIDAAHQAGMRVFAFTGGSHAGHAVLAAELATRRPDRIFADMRLLPELLADRGGRS